MASDAVLRLVGLSKEFSPGQKAVSNVSLDIAQGAFFALLGPSGCGKSTLLRMIAGLETPSSGEIYLSGENITTLPPYRRNVNTVFQSYALFPHLTVRGNVEFGLRYDSKKSDPSRISRVLEQVRLSDKTDRMPHQLSGGERQRVALARALILEPQLLLLDEPLSALDPLLRKQVRSELKDLQRSVGITFVFVTHDQEEALALSDQIAVMHAAAVEQIGTPEAIYRCPASRFVADFLGTMNWIKCVESGREIGLRPEAIQLSTEPASSMVRVERITYLGSFQHVDVRFSTGELVTAQLPSTTGYTVGQDVFVHWNSADEVHLG
jgi:ABC-type Fe3+/spermidine/putrescine transport system ATPase subunit